VTAAAKKVLEDALALPDDDRRRIAELLFDSVSADGADDIEAAWVAEAIRRANELERGDAEALDGESALRDLKAKLQSPAP
jgi:putative addiction module component (TIGR02574 family)